MKTIQDYKKDATLNKVFRFDEGIMSRAAWLDLKKIAGYIAEEKQKRNYSAEEKLSAWLDKTKWDHPWGNDRHPLTIAYQNEKKRLEAGIYKTYYTLSTDNETVFFEITKTEYEYFNSL